RPSWACLTLMGDNVAQHHIDDALGFTVGAEVQSALLDGFGRFPPPASGALVLAGHDGARAGVAANAGVSGRVKGMFRQPTLVRVAENVFGGPVGKGADLYLLAGAVEDVDIGARFGLGAAKSSEKGAEAFESDRQRARLADFA